MGMQLAINMLKLLSVHTKVPKFKFKYAVMYCKVTLAITIPKCKGSIRRQRGLKLFICQLPPYDAQAVAHHCW
jgi:hypothetical protein